MQWIKKEDWYYPSEHIKSFIGLPGWIDEEGKKEFIPVCIDHTPDSWDGFQEWKNKNVHWVKFLNCIMPTQHIKDNLYMWLENIKGPCDLYVKGSIIIMGDTDIDPGSKLDCGTLLYKKLNKPINKSLTNFNLTANSINLEFDTTTPFINCGPIGNYSLTCTFNNPVDLLGVKNIGTLNWLSLCGKILPNHAYELLMSDIKDLNWYSENKPHDMNKFITAIKEFLKVKTKTGWMAVWEFTNLYPEFSEFIPRK